MRTRYIADITDPVTGQVATLEAATAADLDSLVDAHIERHYPDPTEGSAPVGESG